jgi:hypothetical protein
MEVSIQAISTGLGNPLTVTLSDNNFGPTSGSGNAEAQFTGHPFGVGGGAVTFNTYYDTNNSLDALTTLLTGSGTLLPTGSPAVYTSDITSNLSLTGPYSLTEVVTVDGSQAVGYSLSGNLQVSNQPCTCTVNFDCPSNQMICASDPIPDPVAEAALIVATDTCIGPVPVSFIGAVSNGTCPLIITNTFGATSHCGQLFTCQQIVTVNCLPDCDVSTVSNTIVGTSNLTASVQNAGTGATYSWSISNGTITGGQGTSSITYTAGTDTNNPVQVCVTVTSAAGCQSTCCASVKLSAPPTTTLGKGDTATVGYWHNKNGQALITGANGGPTKTNLSFWLSSTFPCLFGSSTGIANLTGDSNAKVAAAFQTAFNQGGLTKTGAQIFGTALACYFTDPTLGGGTASSGQGFKVVPGGTGAATFNVGQNGTAIGVPNNSILTVLQILQATDSNDCPLSAATLSQVNNIFDGINQGGDIK